MSKFKESYKHKPNIIDKMNWHWLISVIYLCNEVYSLFLL